MSACACCPGLRRTAAALVRGTTWRNARWLLADALCAGEFTPRELGIMLRPPLRGRQLIDAVAHLHERPVERVVEALGAVRRCRRRCVVLFALMQRLPADLVANIV